MCHYEYTIANNKLNKSSNLSKALSYKLSILLKQYLRKYFIYFIDDIVSCDFRYDHVIIYARYNRYFPLIIYPRGVSTKINDPERQCMNIRITFKKELSKQF